MIYLPQLQPREPEEFHKLASGPDKRWYRPLLAILIAVPLYAVLSTILLLAPIAISKDTPKYNDLFLGMPDTTDPLVFTALMLSLAVLIPAVLAGVVLGARMRIGYFFSVEGRLRLGWLAVCFAVALPLLLVFFLASFMLEGKPFAPGSNLILLLILTFLLVPFQSAAEELAIRSSILQIFGSFIPGRWISLAVGTLVSTSLFSLLHTSLDVWILAQLAYFSGCAVFLMWYTGGVEAAIAIHASNNMAIFILEAFSGTSESLIDSQTTSTPVAFAIEAFLLSVVTAALAFTAKKMKVQRRHDPALTPRPDSVYLANELSKGRFYPEWKDMYPAHILARYGLIPTASNPTQPATPSSQESF